MKQTPMFHPRTRLRTFAVLTLTVCAGIACATEPQPGLNLMPNPVHGGGEVHGLLLLSQAAPDGGLTANLSSSDTGACEVPASVTVPSGQLYAKFGLRTHGVDADEAVTVSADEGGGNVVTATLNVKAGNFAFMALEKHDVIGGNAVNGVVALDAQAGPSGAAIALSSSDSANAAVPASATIAQNKFYQTFAVTTAAVTADEQVTITGAYGTVTKTVMLNVKAAQQTSAATLRAFKLWSDSVGGGGNDYGYACLDHRAGDGGANIALASDNPDATVPATLNIPAGSKSKSFAVTTSVVSAQETANLSASYNGVTLTASLTINPIGLKRFYAGPAKVAGGGNAMGWVGLNGPAGSGGASVSISSSDPAAQPPASVTINEGSDGAKFAIPTSNVAAETPVTLTADFNGSSLNASFMVEPMNLRCLRAREKHVRGGDPVHFGVMLTGKAPDGGVVVILASSDPSLQVPASVTIPAGKCGVEFQGTTSVVTQGTKVTVTATWNGQSQSVDVYVLSPR